MNDAGFSQGVEHGLDNSRCSFGVGEVRQEHDKLIAASAGQHRSIGQGLLQPDRHGAQDLVAESTAEGVVDHLEMVEIEVQHRHGPLELKRGGQSLARPIFEQAQIGQPRQAVEVSHVVGTFLRRNSLGHFDRQPLVGRAHARDEHHLIDEAVGNDLVGMPQQAVEAVHIGVGGKAQLGENRHQCRGQHAVEVACFVALPGPPERPRRQDEQRDDQPFSENLEAGQTLPFDEGPRP